MTCPSNIALDRTAGSRPLAAAAHREHRWRRLQPESGAPDRCCPQTVATPRRRTTASRRRPTGGGSCLRSNSGRLESV